jgi:predicted HTH domain antitoxin
MSVTIQLPIELETILRGQLGDLDQAAKEALLLELYRQEHVSHHELSQALGLDRFATDALLKKHNVTEDLPTAEELAEDLSRLTQLA